ncbi:hypothetical protein AB833_19800 [Chromatiales bacterium (ex Bugula neritina AB1)]|nr:hypothetical protein AB833_19800 [Chromatiales bacterium (ex Bugula neritina AB1)]
MIMPSQPGVKCTRQRVTDQTICVTLIFILPGRQRKMNTLFARYRRFKRFNQPRYPGFFFTVDAAIVGFKLLLLAAAFMALFYWVNSW